MTFATTREMRHALGRMFAGKLVLAVGLAMVVLAGGHARAACTVPNQLTNGQTADATQVMANFNSVIGCVNAAPIVISTQWAGPPASWPAVGPPIPGQMLIYESSGAFGADTITVPIVDSQSSTGNIAGEAINTRFTGDLSAFQNGIYGYDDESVFTKASGQYSSFSSYAAYTGSTPVALYGFYANPAYSGSSTAGNGSFVSALNAVSIFNGSGTLDTLFGVFGGFSSQAGAVTNAYGVWGSSTASGGAVTNAWSHYSGVNINSGGSINHFWAFYDSVDNGGSPSDPHGFWQAATNHPNQFNSQTTFNAPVILAGLGGAAQCLQANASNQIAGSGRPCGVGYTVPALAGFTWANQLSGSAATQSNAGGPILVNLVNNTTANWQILSITAPATPYKLVVKTHAASFDLNSSRAAGIYFYDGTKIAGLEGLLSSSGDMMRVLHSSALHGGTASQPAVTGQWGGNTLANFVGEIWYQLRNNGTTLYYDYSLDGVNFVNFYSESVGTYITPTKLAIGGLSNASSGSNPLNLSILDWWTLPDANLDN